MCPPTLGAAAFLDRPSFLKISYAQVLVMANNSRGDVLPFDFFMDRARCASPGPRTGCGGRRTVKYLTLPLRISLRLAARMVISVDCESRVSRRFVGPLLIAVALTFRSS
jgi:hypothetical protein